MKKSFLILFLLPGLTIFAQDVSFSKSGKKFYREMPNPAMTNLQSWSSVKKDINVEGFYRSS
jgi:hypothetical protein